ATAGATGGGGADGAPGLAGPGAAACGAGASSSAGGRGFGNFGPPLQPPANGRKPTVSVSKIHHRIRSFLLRLANRRSGVGGRRSEAARIIFERRMKIQ